MLVTTAISGSRSRKLASLSSASATTHSPVPQPALAAAPPGPRPGASPPMKKAGSAPSPRSAQASIAVVVVLPCVPATAISRFSPHSSASSSPRRRRSWPRSRASASSGLSAPIAVETITSAPSGRLSASWPTTGASPAARSRSI